MEKALDVTSSADFAKKIPDLKAYGDPDTWILLCKASSVAGGWMKSTKAMAIPGFGVLVQVSTQQDCQVAEAVVAVEKTFIEKQTDGTYLVKGTPRTDIWGHVLTLAQEGT